MNFSNHLNQLSDHYLQLITEIQIEEVPYQLALNGHVTLQYLTELGNMLMMGGEIAQ